MVCELWEPLVMTSCLVSGLSSSLDSTAVVTLFSSLSSDLTSVGTWGGSVVLVLKWPKLPIIRLVAISILLLPAFKPRQKDEMGLGRRWIRTLSPFFREMKWNEIRNGIRKTIGITSRRGEWDDQAEAEQQDEKRLAHFCRLQEIRKLKLSMKRRNI